MLISMLYPLSNLEEMCIFTFYEGSYWQIVFRQFFGNTLACLIDRGWNSWGGGGSKDPQILISGQVGVNGGGCKMARNVVERLWLLIMNLYQSNITKSMERTNAEPYNTCDQRIF